jgi:hypothetical protein
LPGPDVVVRALTERVEANHLRLLPGQSDHNRRTFNLVGLLA